MQRSVLEIADELRAIATTGLHYGEGQFDRERYQKLLDLAVRLAGTAAGDAAAELEPIYRGDQGYVTPKLDVRLAIFREDRVLLVRERSDGLWCLPGGFIDVGESPSEAAVRETAEEAGVATRVRGLVGVYDNRLRPDAPVHLFHIYKLVFLGELADPAAEPAAGDETDAAAFFPAQALPDLSRGRTLPTHVDHALRMAREARTRTHFD
jgi:ADP-ribose pyrophosphatase YjhB (NUDIX family)